eukprot:7107507-Pyramimonas_sp.AAC.2
MNLGDRSTCRKLKLGQTQKKRCYETRCTRYILRFWLLAHKVGLIGYEGWSRLSMLDEKQPVRWRGRKEADERQQEWLSKQAMLE